MKNLFNEKYYNEQKFRFGEISEKISPEEIENMYSEIIAEFPDKGLTVFQNDGRNFYELYNLDKEGKNSLNTNSILVGGLFDDSFFRITDTGIAFKNGKGEFICVEQKVYEESRQSTVTYSGTSLSRDGKFVEFKPEKAEKIFDTARQIVMDFEKDMLQEPIEQ